MFWILTCENASTCNRANNEYMVHSTIKLESYLSRLCFVVTPTIAVVVAEDEPDRVRLLSLSPFWVYHWVVKLDPLRRIKC